MDIGAAAGIFLNCAKERGWKIEGTELSRQCINYAKNTFGIELKQGMLEDLKLEVGIYDVVTMLQSIEHLPDLISDLRKVYSALKEDGILYITAPEHALDREKLRKNHMLPHHIYNFTRDSLEKVLLKTGFKLTSYEGFMARSGIENMNVVAVKNDIL